MQTRHARKLASGALTLIVLGCLWFYFAPVSLGGSTSYVVTDGISMEPRFHGGDLAVVRGQSSYHVGEIVAYHNKMFHTIVLHRIVGRVGDRYLFKGDNNNFVDFEHPAASQLIGSLWLHFPGWGARLNSLRSPGLIAALTIFGTLVLLGGAFAQRGRRRRRQRRADAGGSQSPELRISQQLGEPLVTALTVGLVALLPFVALALLSFTRPATALLPTAVPYKQSGTLSYTADSPPGPAYPGNRAVTGDPLFTHLVNTVELNFAYLFESAASHSVAGKVSLDATVASTSGWQTTFALGHPNYFHGDHAQLSASLDLSSLLALLHRVETTTAVSGTYTLTLVPHVSATGNVSALPLSTTFAPRILFSLNELELRPAAAKGGSETSGLPAASPFAPVSAGSVTGRHYQPLFLSLKLARMSVATAREIALSAIVLIVCALMAIVAFVRPRDADVSRGIRARYGRLLVPVESVSPLPGVTTIDVADMESLVRIAEHYDRSILHETTADGEAFWVSDESGRFRYAIGEVEQTMPAVAEQAPEHSPPQAPYVFEQAPVEIPVVFEQSPFENPVTAVYAHEPMLGAVAAEQVAQPVAEIIPGEPAADLSAHDAASHDVADAIVQEWRAGWQSAEAGRTQVGTASPRKL